MVDTENHDVATTMSSNVSNCVVLDKISDSWMKAIFRSLASK